MVVLFSLTKVFIWNSNVCAIVKRVKFLHEIYYPFPNRLFKCVLHITSYSVIVN